MIQHPGILAILGASLLASLLLVYAAGLGVRILRSWRPDSGSELQLSLERRTYLVSTILGLVFAFEIASLFLFIFTADRLHSQFVGAMCAAGSLGANAFGYPALLAKMVACFWAGVWLIVNHADTRGYDYPLVRFKYGMLLGLVPLVLLDHLLVYRYFTGLAADVITSCCGSLFSVEQGSLSADLAALPARPMMKAFYGSMAATLAAGLFFRWRGRGATLFSALSLASLLIAAASLLSFICLYLYELPTHHCPFCMLQEEYGYLGYLLYACLLGGGVAGLGVGVLALCQGPASLSRVIPPLQRRLATLAISLYAVFTLIASYRMLATPFRL
ncbi:MAG: hypothetical protein AB1634_09265 [Thermodesulfobacteriota bacterium]